MWTEVDIPAQDGHVAVVTGANGGLGLEVARALAAKGATVVMAARNQDKAREAEKAIAAEVPGAALDVRELDLASLDSVRACAAGIAAEHPRVDLLVNNAGLMGIPEEATAEGFEMQLGVNHLGHFVLTRRLLPALLAAPSARVVSVTSFARMMGLNVRPENPHLRGSYGPWRAYGQSKLANLLFALELQRRLDETGGGLAQRFWHTMASTAGMSPARGALPLLRAATDPAARGGQLYAPRFLTFGPPVRRPALGRPGQAGQRLWEVSERETGEPFDVAEIVRAAS